MPSKDNQNQSDVSNTSSTTPPIPKKNQYTREYWKEEEEQILRDWADKAQCYELMHSKSHEIYNYRNTMFVIPVIIISTITGTANFAQDRVPESKKAAFVMAVGAFNILAAIISTIAQYLKISELNESYRVGTLQWGKFYRNIKTELAKHPLDRVPPGNMLSMAKEEFDRLLEIYPDIPRKVIREFKVKFDNTEGISKPEICDVIEPTSVYPMTVEERLEMIRKLNNIPDDKEVKINETQGDTNVFNYQIDKNEPVIEETSEQKEHKEKMNKFKQTFYKINNRYPTDEEVRESTELMFKNVSMDSSSTTNSVRPIDEQVHLTNYDSGEDSRV
jgi:hypothetical protein